MSLRIYYTNNIWNFPRWVAKQHNYFDKYGLSVKLVKNETYQTESDEIYKRKNVGLFEKGKVDLYSACEWGTIKRVSERKHGHIISQRAVSKNIPYSIYVSDSSITSIEDLADVPVAMKNHSGSHYATIEMLEQSSTPNHAATVHVGRPVKRLNALVNGSVTASTLMGPMIEAAEVLGFNCVSKMPAGGAFVGHTDLERGTIELLIEALNDAIRDINENPEDYREYIIDMMVSELQDTSKLLNHIDTSDVEDQIEVPRYDKLMHLPRIDELDQKLQWMQARDLVKPGIEIERIVRAK